MTLNQLAALLKDFATTHPQINFFGEGVLPEIGAAKDVRYPMMWVTFERSRWHGSTQEFPLRIIFADQIFSDKKNNLEVQSDMLQVAQDLAAHLNDPKFDFIAGQTFEMLFFTDAYTDLIAGVDMYASIRDLKPLDRCVIPV